MTPGRRKLLTLTESAARRLADTVRRVDRLYSSASPPVVGGMGDDGEAYLCKTTAAWAKDTEATLQIWAGTAGSEADTGVTLKAWNKHQDVPSGQFVTVMLHRGSGYYFLAPAGGSLILGKTNADWAVNSQATVPVWTGAPGAEADSGTTQVAYNRLCKVLSGKWVWLGAVGGNYYLVAVQMEQQTAVYNAKLTSTDLVFERKKFWAPTTEEGTDVLIPLDDCEA